MVRSVRYSAYRVKVRDFWARRCEQVLISLCIGTGTLPHEMLRLFTATRPQHRVDVLAQNLGEASVAGVKTPVRTPLPSG